MTDAADLLGLLIGAAALSAVLNWVLRPLLQRYAMARPNARSSHAAPTPQGAGVAVIFAALGGMLFAVWQGQAPQAHLPVMVLAILALAGIGIIDDIWPSSAAWRLVVQALAALALVSALPDGARALPFVPRAVEFVIATVGIVWFVNLTNFMDGIDGMTVAGIVPPLTGVALLAAMAHSPSKFDVTIALSLIGALLGFAPFNRHVAKVFLGDVGSLAIGGIVGWLLLGLACRGQLIAALILPLYYLGDTGLTLYRRWRRGAQLSQAHREHCYQLATIRGFSVPQVIARVWILNGVLLSLALLAGTTPQLWLQGLCLLLAGLLVAAMLRHLGGDGMPHSGIAISG